MVGSEDDTNGIAPLGQKVPDIITIPGNLKVRIGSRAADVAIGNIVANLVTAVVVLMFLPFKSLRKFFDRSDGA